MSKFKATVKTKAGL